MTSLFSKSRTDTEALRRELEGRGMTWPLGGYAPGQYVGGCKDCGDIYDGDKRSTLCLKCAAWRVVDEHSDFVRMRDDLRTVLSERETEVGITDPHDWRYPTWCTSARERIRLLSRGIDAHAPQVAIMNEAGA